MYGYFWAVEIRFADCINLYYTPEFSKVNTFVHVIILQFLSSVP